MYGYGTVEYHFGRPGSARATYTCSRSHADCHFASICHRSPGFATPRTFVGARASACARAFFGRMGARRGFGLARGRGRTLRLAARRVCDFFRRPRRAPGFFAPPAPKRGFPKNFCGGSQGGTPPLPGGPRAASLLPTKKKTRGP